MREVIGVPSSRTFDLAVPGADLPYQVGLLGAFTLQYRARAIRPSRGVQRLVAYLALHEHPRFRSHVAGTLWPDADEARAMGNLRSVLWRLGALPEPLVAIAGDTLALSARATVDVRRLEGLARDLIDGDDREATALADLEGPSVRRLTHAGDLLADWSEEWLDVERERFRQLRLHALERLCGAMARAGRYGRAIEACLVAVAGEPLRESAHRQLIEVHLAEGNRVEALRQFDAYRHLMRDELGLDPSPQIEDLVAAMR